MLQLQWDHWLAWLHRLTTTIPSVSCTHLLLSLQCFYNFYTHFPDHTKKQHCLKNVNSTFWSKIGWNWTPPSCWTGFITLKLVSVTHSLTHITPSQSSSEIFRIIRIKYIIMFNFIMFTSGIWIPLSKKCSWTIIKFICNVYDFIINDNCKLSKNVLKEAEIFYPKLVLNPLIDRLYM